jgi:Kef-type K+ transport system membrane component KefB/voltage-gated potassium channel Kch
VGNFFLDLTVIICLAAVLSYVFRLLKQPEILAYILTGIIIGFFHYFQSSNQDILQTMSQIGVTLLLFMVGLEIKVSELFSLGKSLVIAAVGQVGLTILGGFAIATFFGFDLMSSFYIAMALTFSSTIIVVKVLSDKREMHALYAKFAIGILLAQDIVAIALLMLLSGVGTKMQGMEALVSVILIFIKGGILVGIVALLSRHFFPKFIESIAKSSETLFLVSLAWVFGLAAIVSSQYVGFSIEIGGFLAGLALANTMANYQIIAKAKILRDFFIVIFFVLLGIQMSFADLPSIIIPAIFLSLFVLGVKPLLVTLVMAAMGYRKRTAFLTGVSLAQISEFSLILIFMGYKLGQINQRVVSLITVVGLISFFVSTYGLINSKVLYKLMAPYLGFLERSDMKKDEISEPEDSLESLEGHVVVIGGDQMGESIMEALEDRDMDVVVVDFDPNILKKLATRKVHRLFGDIADLDIQERARLDQAKLVISTIPDVEDNILLLKELKHENRKAKVVMMALDSHDAKLLYKEGADYVILPHLAGGRQMAELILDNHLDKIESLKLKDVKYLG